MKIAKIFFFGAMFCLCFANPAHGFGIDVLYIDRGFLCYCMSPVVADASVEFTFIDLISFEKRTFHLPGSVFPAAINDTEPYAARFPIAWAMTGGRMRAVFPNLHIDEMGRVSFLVWEDDHAADEKSSSGKMTSPEQSAKGYVTVDGVMRYTDWKGKGEHFEDLSSMPFAIAMSQGLSRENMSAIWYDIDGANIIARLPFACKGSTEWEFCKEPSLFRWKIFQRNGLCEEFSSFASWQDSMVVHTHDVFPDGFSPEGSVRVSGRRVQCDSSNASFPEYAEWLIWERKGDANRLCQISGGRWSVCKDVQFAEVPKIIVVNNDENCVFLSFSLDFDQSGVTDSMKRLVAYLKDNDALHPERLKIKNLSSKNENSPIAENLKKEKSVSVRRISGSECGISKATPKLDASAKSDLEKLTSEDRAKKGAELYERPETRKEGLAILRKSAKEGSPFALARLSALYYLGEGGVRQDYATSLRLMKSAVAKGFPSFLLPIAEAEAAVKREKKAKGKPLAILPGDGYPGRLEPYFSTPGLKEKLDSFNLSCGWFRRNPLPEEMPQSKNKDDLLSNEIPYLLFTPKRGQHPVPLLVYFGGTGEQGTDLAAHFHQTTIFSKITSREFQEDHPCYLFAPMVPKNSKIRCMKSWSPPMADLVCDAMYAVIRDAKHPKIDMDRIYLTGLSYGGSAAWTFPFGYPGRFAASVPVAGYAGPSSVPDEHPGNFWFLYNENEYKSESSRSLLAELAALVYSRGGEFKSSAFPDEGHNAWDKAWMEDSVWDWMFSKTLKNSSCGSVPKPDGAILDGSGLAAIMRRPACTASKPGLDDGSGPERAMDGLDATCYVSAEPFKRGDWWQVEFAEPVSGRIAVKSGYRDGTCRIEHARVETSSDGGRWLPAGRFRVSVGDCTFVPRRPVKFLRVVSESQSGETLVLREVSVQ